MKDLLLISCSLVGIVVIWITARPNSWARFGYIFGLCCIPVLLYFSVAGESLVLSVIVLCVLYFIVFFQGIYTHFIGVSTNQNSQRSANHAGEISKQESLATDNDVSPVRELKAGDFESR